MFDHEMLEKLEESGEFRILRRLDLSGVPHMRDVAADFSISTFLALDVETTGTNPERDSIIELAARLVSFDEDGNVVALGDAQSWLEDPGVPLSPTIRRITGLTDADLKGQKIDEEAFKRLLWSSEFLASHNAGFDRKFVEKRFPAFKGLCWACSCHEIDWPQHAFDGRALQSLLCQCGWFAPKSHRAGADVEALIALLMHRFDNGDTALAEMLARARRTTWKVSADGAAFDVKGDLKERGYKWDARACVWWAEVEEDALDAERRWLSANVYAPRFYPQLEGPRVERLTWRERFA